MPTVNELGRKHAKRTEQTFTVDGKFLRDEAREALRSYFMPFAGLYAAAVGKEVRVVSGSSLDLQTDPSKKPARAVSKRKPTKR